LIFELLWPFKLETLILAFLRDIKLFEFLNFYYLSEMPKSKSPANKAKATQKSKSPV
jgi:hypothetical protein